MSEEGMKTGGHEDLPRKTQMNSTTLGKLTRVDTAMSLWPGTIGA